MLKAGCGYSYSIHRTIKRLSKAHLTFLVNYVISEWGHERCRALISKSVTDVYGMGHEQAHSAS